MRADSDIDDAARRGGIVGNGAGHVNISATDTPRMTTVADPKICYSVGRRLQFTQN
jgi:hypothetical protein